MKSVENKNPSRLRKLDWDDWDHYSELSRRSVDDQIDAVEDRLFVLRWLKKGGIELSGTVSSGQEIKVITSDTARACRIRVRDLKVQINLLQECLERIEVTGDWTATAPRTFAGR